MKRYRVLLEPGVWLAIAESGSPWRTLFVDHAKIFDSRSAAERGLEHARTFYPFRTAKIQEVQG